MKRTMKGRRGGERGGGIEREELMRNN